MVRISVIMAAYNCKDYIDSSIRSILDQSFNDVEIIICDDSSTDGTWESLRRYGKNEKIRLIRNLENSGSAYTRNRCIAAAVGDYIAIQDADDFSDPDRLAKEVAFLDTHPEFDFVGTGITLFDEKGDWFKVYNEEEIPEKQDFLPGLPFSHASLMFRSNILKGIGGYRVAKETRRVEDYDMVMRLYAAGYHGYNLHELLYHYRVDKETLGRRKYRFRVDEATMRYKRFKELGLLPKGALYILLPLLVGLIPRRIRTLLKVRRTKVAH